MTEYRAVAVVGLTRALAAGRLHVKPWLVADGPEGYLLWASGSPGTELEPQASPAYLYELGDDLAGDIANDLERGGDVLDIPSGGVAQYWVGQDPESEQLLRSLGAN